MKRKTKILLISITVVLVGFGAYAYSAYQEIVGSEELSGSQSEIPKGSKIVEPLTKGQSDWTNWRGNNFDGKSNEQAINTDWTRGLKKEWEVDFLCQGQTTATWSAPVVVGNRVIVPGRSETKDLVFCLNANDGTLIWKGEYVADAGSSHGPGARATPFIDEDYVYTFGRSGDLVCWQLLDGKKVWHKNVKDAGGEEPMWGFSSTPLVIKGKVIVQGGGTALVQAYDKMSGELVWKSLEGGAGYSATVPLKIDDENSILVYHGKALSCLNIENGNENWNVPWVADYDVNATTPAIDGDIIFHTTGRDKGGQAIKYEKNKYEVLWTDKKYASSHSDPFIIDGYIYGYFGASTKNKGEFKCIELKTGKEMWSTEEIGYGTGINVAGYIICLDLKGSLYLVKPEPSGFMKVSEIPNVIPEVKNLAWTAPVVANGKLYLRYMQRIICFDLS